MNVADSFRAIFTNAKMNVADSIRVVFANDKMNVADSFRVVFTNDKMKCGWRLQNGSWPKDGTGLTNCTMKILLAAFIWHIQIQGIEKNVLHHICFKINYTLLCNVTVRSNISKQIKNTNFWPDCLLTIPHKKWWGFSGIYMTSKSASAN
jgi:hypothetical protein